MCTADFFLAFLAILFPPLSVWIKRGICSADSLINIALCMLGYLPGLIHAWYIIAKYPEDLSSAYEPIDAEAGRRGGCSHRQQHQRQQRHGYVIESAPAHQAGYATFGHEQGQQVHAPARYQDRPAQTEGQNGQQTQQQAHAGPSGGQQDLPSYAEVVKGDFKVQTQD